MGLNEDQKRELNRDGKVEILSINSSEHGSHILFSSINHGGQLPDRLMVRSAFFDKAGRCIYNMIVSNEKIVG